MAKGTITMSHQELDRLAVIRSVAEKRLRQHEAAIRLGLGVRQVKRLVRRYRESGPPGLVSGHRGKRSNRAYAPSVRRAVVDLVAVSASTPRKAFSTHSGKWVGVNHTPCLTIPIS